MKSPYETELQEIEEKRNRDLNAEALKKSFQLADIFINRDYLDRFSMAVVESGPLEQIENTSKIGIYQINKIVFDTKEDIKDKLISVYNSLHNIQASVAVIMKGFVDHIDFFIAVRSESSPALACDMVKCTLQSNFPGIKLSDSDGNDVNEILSSLEYGSKKQRLLNGLATVSLVPSIRDKDKKDQFIQGIEKLVYTLQGKEYIALMLASSLSQEMISERKHGLEELGSFLSPHAKFSYTYGENQSIAVNKGISDSFTSSVNKSVSKTHGTSSTSTESTSSSRNSGYSFGGGSSYEGGSSNWGYSGGSSSGSSSSYSSGTTFSDSVSNSVGQSHGSTTNIGETKSIGSSETKTIHFENKGVTDLINRINENIQRINQWESYGLWDSCAYFFSDEISTAVLAASTYKSLMTGEQTYLEKAHVNIWNGNRGDQESIENIYNKVKYLMHPIAKMTLPKELGNISAQYMSPSIMVGGNELGILLGLPRKSVAGVAIQEMAEYGRSVVYENKKPEKQISIGNIYHMGIEDEYAPVIMDVDLFSSHCFITGSSGSGKSYATYNLLGELLNKGIKMMVIEPAKGEYKTVFGGLKGVNIFTTSTETYRLLRINPFQFPEHVHVLSHIEQLLQIFNASWPLYAAMPAILKQAVVTAYKKCGWDIQNSIWIPTVSDHKYPVFQDVLRVLPDIINTSDYSADSKGDYKGALLTRVEAMTSGLNGLIFKKSEGVSDKELFDENTLIDLSEVGSDETIALLMGVLIMRLNEYRKSQRKSGLTSSHDSGLKHITVLEEAHNLLKRTSKDQNQEGANMVGKSVEMISNSIKEMRTYGEGFMIIDQSPLAVDESAIENTATKIVLNTPSKDACKELGSALALNENQSMELSRLNVGIAAVFQKGWLSPVLLKVKDWKGDDYEAELQFEDAGMMKYVRTELLKVFCEQMLTKQFKIGKLKSIIRNSNLTRDRKDELSEMLLTYQNYRNKYVTITEEMAGEIIIEISNCDSLFDIIPSDRLSNLVDANAIIYSDRSDVEEWVEDQRKAALEWILCFEDAYKNYVNIQTRDEYYQILFFMLAYKGEMGKNVDSIYGWLFMLFMNMELPVDEMDDFEDV